jgi:hypothetical protein
MLDMPSTSAARRLILVPATASPRERPPTPGVRRFRLAQLRLEGRDVPRGERFTHLKRSHD